MSELKPRIRENGIDYILVGDYYIPDLKTAGGKPPHRKIWTITPGILEGNPPCQITGIDTDRGTVDISCRFERTGAGTVRHHHGADESCRGCKRGIETYPTNGMGAVHEQYSQPGRRNCVK